MIRSLMWVVLLASASPVAAAEVDAIANALKAIPVDKAAVDGDMERFCLARIPAMPAPSDRATWEAYISRARSETLEKVVFRGEAAKWRSIPTKVEWLDVTDAGDYLLRKLRYEAIPGMWVCGVLYEPKNLSGKVPVVLNVNGHDRDGKAARYKQIRCINLVKRGLLALNLEWFNMGQLRAPEFDHYRLNHLDLCGTSGVSCFYLAMSRGIDALLEHPHADPQRVAVTGLSGGGWQTIFISSLDERVALCDPVAGYSSFRTRAVVRADLGDSEQTPTDLATTADYAVLTAMRAPRPTLLTFNDRDNCCFTSGDAVPELLKAARPVFQLYGQDDNFEIHINHSPGTHNYDQDNREAFYRMVGKHFFPDARWNSTDLPCENEVRTAEQLAVPLPEGNAGFTTVARRLASEIRRPAMSDNAVRARLRDVLRYEPQTVGAESVSTSQVDGVTIQQWRLRIGDAWTLMATEFVPPEVKGNVILLADEGRKSAAAAIAEELKQQRRVLTFDPQHVGDSKTATRDFLFGLLVAAVGQRPLGVQASQINAVADWWAPQCGGKVGIRSLGHRTSLMGWCAAALSAGNLTGVTTTGALESLTEIFDRGLAVPDGPELFCFGLLEVADAADLKRLANRQPPQP